MKRFGIIIGVVAVIGLTMALVADPTDGDRDAWREVGGAIVSGAVLAALVVWFEDRREEQRDGKTLEREDAAAVRAWRREIDIQFVGIVRTRLAVARIHKLSELEERTAYPSLAALAKDRNTPESRSMTPPLPAAQIEITSLLAFLRDPLLDQEWEVWAESFVDLQDVGPPTSPDQPRAVVPPPQPLRDPEMHQFMARAETAAWGRFTKAVADYVERSYPLASDAGE